MIKLTDKDHELLKQFPEYDDKPEHWVGSREYWQSIFEYEKNRDQKLHEAFDKLHHQIVNLVVAFVKEHDLNVDEFDVHADGLLGSKPFGEWTCATDSSMSMDSVEDGIIDRQHPFLYQI